MIDSSNPGADLLGSTSAALAAASSVFQTSDPTYSATLLAASQTLFRWGTAALHCSGGHSCTAVRGRPLPCPLLPW